MNRRLGIVFALSLAALLAGSCAVTDEQSQVESPATRPALQDPARIGLPPIYRVFYDELRDEGDWTLIEPYGYCFRPRVNFVAWRPYLDGWWEPSDFYGWIWDSNERFGWITYHYGSWFYDNYQGWVWQPGAIWGPAWVAWVSLGDFVGWAPLAPAQYDGFSAIPGGLFTYSPASQLTMRDVSQQAAFLTQVPETQEAVHSIMNVGRVNGIAFNKGPDFLDVQRKGAPMPERVDPGELRRVKIAPNAVRLNEADLLERTSRIASEGMREWRAYRDGHVAPPELPAGGRMHPPIPTPAPAPAPVKVIAPAPRDSVQRHGRPAPSPRDSMVEVGRRAQPHAPAPERGADRDTTR